MEVPLHPILLLDETLKMEIFFDCNDCDLEDNICVRISESCPEEEKIFRHDESNIYLTVEQANAILVALQKAIDKSQPKKK